MQNEQEIQFNFFYTKILYFFILVFYNKNKSMVWNVLGMLLIVHLVVLSKYQEIEDLAVRLNVTETRLTELTQRFVTWTNKPNQLDPAWANLAYSGLNQTEPTQTYSIQPRELNQLDLTKLMTRDVYYQYHGT